MLMRNHIEHQNYLGLLEIDSHFGLFYIVMSTRTLPYLHQVDDVYSHSEALTYPLILG